MEGNFFLKNKYNKTDFICKGLRQKLFKKVPDFAGCPADLAQI